VSLHPTDPALHEARAALAAREPLFHRPGFGTTRAEADALMAPDYLEISASGRVFTREYVLGVIGERNRVGAVEILEARDVACREPAPGLYQLTYRLRQGDRTTWRSSLWRRTADGWQVVFHQGTVVVGVDKGATGPGPDHPAP
jgi:hypothetical protein